MKVEPLKVKHFASKRETTHSDCQMIHINSIIVTRIKTTALTASIADIGAAAAKAHSVPHFTSSA
jgi:hypothetical protein